MSPHSRDDTPPARPPAAPDSQNDRGGYIEWLNDRFSRFGVWCFDHRLWVATGSLGVLAIFLALATTTRFDNSFENYFDPGDPAYGAYNVYREDFGSDETSYILYEVPKNRYGPWDIEVMRKIAQLGEALEAEVPFVKEVTTLANAEWIEPSEDGIRVDALLEEFPESQQALLDLRDKVLAKPLYVGGLASADGRSAAVILEMEKSSVDPLEEIRLDPDGGDGLGNLYPQVSYDKIEEILARPEFAGITFYHTGDVAANAVINEIAADESGRLGAITFALIAVTLLAFFRRPIGVIGPMAVVLMSLVVAVGAIGLLGWNMDLLFGMLPNLLIAIGVANAVHIISEFRAFHAELGDRREALRRTLELVGAPCLLTSLTTAAGFASVSIAPIKTLSHFAVYGAVGVLAAFVLSISTLMVFLSTGRRHRDPEWRLREIDEAKGGRAFERALEAVAHFDSKHRKGILIASGLVFVLSMAGMAQMRVDSNFLNDFTERVPVRQATAYADEVMGGTDSFALVFDTGEPDGIKNPAVLREIERLQHIADRQTEVVKKTYSIVDLLKDINQSFHGGDPAYYVLPDSRELVAQYLLVYEMSGGDELEDYVSSDYARAALDLRCKWAASSALARMAAALDRSLEDEPLRHSTLARTGIGALWLELMDYITKSQIEGFLLAFGVIAALMCLLFQSLRVGLLAMLPNLSPVLLTLGAMGWFDIPLNYSTLLVAPVAIGIAVDDTMHLTMRLRHEFRRCGRYEEALYAALSDVGRALFITSFVLVLGFSVSVFSVMQSQVNFGLLLAATIVTALVADFALLPALILVFRPFGAERPGLSVPPGDGLRNGDSASAEAGRAAFGPGQREFELRTDA